MGKYREILHDLLHPVLTKHGYTLYRLEERFVKGELTLKIVIDRTKPISLNEIVRISEIIGELLDQNDVISESYLLDISSAGAEKKFPVSEIHRYLNQYVHLTLKEALNGETAFTGTITAVDEENVTLTYFQKGQKKQTPIPLRFIASSRCAVKI